MLTLSIRVICGRANLPGPIGAEHATMRAVSDTTPYRGLYRSAAARIMATVSTEGYDLSTPVGEAWRWLFGDALTHEADLYETLDANRRPPSDAIAAGLTAAVGRWRHHLADSAVPALEVVIPGLRVWWVGRPEHHHVTLRVDAYDLWRFLYGRTSRQRVEEFAWSQDSSPYLDLGLPYPFQFPVGV